MPPPWKTLPIPISDEDLAIWSKLLSPLRVTGVPPTMEFSAPGRPLSAERICMFFESTSNLKILLRRAANFDAGSTQLLHISACLRQGREFFQDARTGEGMTRPISLFYGMASFAKAVILSYGRPKTLDKLSPTHGLEAPNRYDKKLENLEVVIKRRGPGQVLFHSFVECLRENSRVPAEARRQAPAPTAEILPTSAFWIWVPSASADELHNSHFNLSELLSVIPGLEALFGHTFNRLPSLIKAHLRFGLVQPTGETPVASLIVSNPQGSLTVDALYQRVPQLRKWRLFTRGEDWLVFENLPPGLEPRPATASEQMAHLTPLAEILPPFIGDRTLAGALNNHWLPEAVSLYLAAFLLSSVARYRPDLWIGLATFDPQAPQVRMKALIEAYFEIALERFPLHCLGVIASTALV